MCKSKWASLALGTVFMIAAAAGIRAWAEGPAAGEPPPGREGGPPPGDERGPPPRERRADGPPRDDFRPEGRGPRDEGREGRRPEGRGGPGERQGNREEGPPPPRPELGLVLPPFVRGEMKLTDEQQKQIDDLQKDVRTKLKTILTADQISRAEEAMRQGPPRLNGPDRRGDMQGRGPDGGGPDARGPEGRRPEGRGPEARGPEFRGPGPGEGGDGPRRFDGPRDGGPGAREGRRPPPDDRRDGPPPRDGGRRPPPEDDRRSEAPKDAESGIGENAPV